MHRLVEGIHIGLRRSLERMFRPRGRTRRGQARIVALTHSPHTKLALRLAAFRENWHFAIATSCEHALELMERCPVMALMYDADSDEADWRSLCALAVESGIGFHLIARNPSDELFLSVICAGGAGVMAKPVTSEQLASAVELARQLTEARLTGAEIW